MSNQEADAVGCPSETMAILVYCDIAHESVFVAPPHETNLQIKGYRSGSFSAKTLPAVTSLQEVELFER